MDSVVPIVGGGLQNAASEPTTSTTNSSSSSPLQQNLSYHPLVLVSGVSGDAGGWLGSVVAPDTRSPSDQQQQPAGTLRAFSEDELAEATASNWVQSHSAQQHSSANRHSSTSGGLQFAGAGPVYQRRTTSPHNTAAGSSSRHAGFLHAPLDKAAFLPHPAEAGGQLLVTSQPHVANAAAAAVAAAAGAVAVVPSSSADAANTTSQQRLEWLKFQQQDIPVSSSNNSAALMRSNSSPQPALAPLLQSTAQHISPAPPLSGHTTRSDRSDRGVAGTANKWDIILSGSRSSIRAPAALQQGILPPAAAAAVAAVAAAAVKSPVVRLAGGRFSLDSTSSSSSSSRWDRYSSSARQQLQQQQHNWHEMSLQDPRLGSTQATTAAAAAARATAKAPTAQRYGMPAWPELAPAGPLEPQSSTQMGSELQLQADIPCAAAINEELLLLLQAHQHQNQQLQQRPASSPPFLPGAWDIQQAPAADAPAAVLAAGAASHRQQPRMGLSPEAAAASALAAASIQEAMAAVDEEMQQLQLLLEVTERRRRLQAAARVAVARANAAAAACVAASAAAAGTVQSAVLPVLPSSLRFVGRMSSLGSTESSSGAANGSSSSTHASTHSSNAAGTMEALARSSSVASVAGQPTAVAALQHLSGPYSSPLPSIDAGLSQHKHPSGVFGSSLSHSWQQQQLLLQTKGAATGSAADDAAEAATQAEVQAELQHLAHEAQQWRQLQQAVQHMRGA